MRAVSGPIPSGVHATGTRGMSRSHPVRLTWIFRSSPVPADTSFDTPQTSILSGTL